MQVHRLLTPDNVDVRMIEMLDAKRQLFDDYARRSSLGEATPEAVDISEAELARTIIEEEQARFAFESITRPER